MSDPPPLPPVPGHPRDAPGAGRTYVVLGCEWLLGVARPVRPLGTLRAPNLRTARALAPALARARLGPEAAALAVRVVRASACRPAWLWHALAEDGAPQASPPESPAVPDR